MNFKFFFFSSLCLLASYSYGADKKETPKEKLISIASSRAAVQRMQPQNRKTPPYEKKTELNQKIPATNADGEIPPSVEKTNRFRQKTAINSHNSESPLSPKTITPKNILNRSEESPNTEIHLDGIMEPGPVWNSGAIHKETQNSQQSPGSHKLRALGRGNSVPAQEIKINLDTFIGYQDDPKVEEAPQEKSIKNCYSPKKMQKPLSSSDSMANHSVNKPVDLGSVVEKRLKRHTQKINLADDSDDGQENPVYELKDKAPQKKSNLETWEMSNFSEIINDDLPKEKIDIKPFLENSPSDDNFYNPVSDLEKARKYIRYGNYEELDMFLLEISPEDLFTADFYDLFIYDAKNGYRAYDVLLKHSEKWNYPQQKYPKRLLQHIDITQFFFARPDKTKWIIDLLFSYGLLKSDDYVLEKIRDSKAPGVIFSFIDCLSDMFAYGPLSFPAIKILGEILAKGEFNATQKEKVWEKVSQENRNRILPLPLEHFNREQFLRWINQDANALASDFNKMAHRIMQALSLDDLQEIYLYSGKNCSSNPFNRIAELDNSLVIIIPQFIAANDYDTKRKICRKLFETLKILKDKGNLNYAYILYTCLDKHKELLSDENKSRVIALYDFFLNLATKAPLDKFEGDFFQVSLLSLYVFRNAERIIKSKNDMQVTKTQDLLRQGVAKATVEADCAEIIEESANDMCLIFKSLYLAFKRFPHGAEESPSGSDSEYVKMLLTLPHIPEGSVVFENYILSKKVKTPKLNRMSQLFGHVDKTVPTFKNSEAEEIKEECKKSPHKTSTSSTERNSITTSDEHESSAQEVKPSVAVSSPSKPTISRIKRSQSFSSFGRADVGKISGYR